MNFKKQIFSINSYDTFSNLALKIFIYQAKYNLLYRKYIKMLNIIPLSIKNIYEIPFLPISFFKTNIVNTNNKSIKKIFVSSGTSGISSKHYISDISLYKKNTINIFNFFFDNIQDYRILALLPKNKNNSSLIYMINNFINKTFKNGSRFIDNDYDYLYYLIKKDNIKTILFGTSFSLLDFSEKFFKPINNKNIIIMETGGMKKERVELPREELHSILKKYFNVKNIYSEYGMTELLSQSYSKMNGIFNSPP